MKMTMVCRAALAVLLCWGNAAAAANSSAVTPLTSPHDAPNSAAPVTRYDFGEAMELGGEPIQHIFVLKNAGRTPLTVDRLAPTCGCTSAAAEDGASLKAPILPGQSVKVRVGIDLSRVVPGNVAKSVLVYLIGRQQPAATLEIAGRLKAGARFQPDAMEFGDVPAGAKPSQTLTITLDPQSSLRAAPKLVTTVSGLLIGDPVPAPGADAKQGLSFVYPITISERAFLGSLSGIVSVVGKDVQGNDTPLNVFVPVRGQVLGEISAAPTTLTITRAVIDKPVFADVQLHAARREILGDLTIWSPSTEVTAKLLPRAQGNSGTDGDPQATLRVTVNAKTPVQSMQTQLFVTTHRGQQLLLPIFVSIEPTEK